MDLKSIKGIADNTEKKLNNLGIYNIQDLIEYYPYRYNFINLTPIKDVKEDEVVTVKCIVAEIPRVQYIKRNFNRMIFKAISGNDLFNVTIFNRAFLKPHLTLHKEIVLFGKYKRLNNSFVASDIKFNIIGNTIEPVYHLVEGLTNSNMIKYINEALKSNIYYDYLPNIYSEKYHFLNKREAVNLIHRPQKKEDIKASSLRLKYEELFNFMFKINYLKKINNKSKGIKREFENNYIDEFKTSLSFNLTKDQEIAIEDIYKDLTSESRMNRLILGDVGSGKTVIATFAIYLLKF